MSHGAFLLEAVGIKTEFKRITPRPMLLNAPPCPTCPVEYVAHSGKHSAEIVGMSNFVCQLGEVMVPRCEVKH